MSRGKPNKRYTPEFKKLVVETMMKEKLSYRETARRFEVCSAQQIINWERIYLSEGPEAFTIERRGRGSSGRPRKLPKEGEEDLLAEVLRLRAENEYLKKLASLGFGRRATPAQKTLVVQKLRQKYSLNLLLSIAQLPRATFYYHLKRMQKTDKYASAKEEITTIFHENKGRYGYRRITAVLRSRGFLVNHKTVQRLMKVLGLICRVRMKKYRSYKGNVGKIAPNLLNRDFHAGKPNQKWVTDVTEFQLVWRKALSVPDSRSAQQRSGQLHDFRPSGTEHGDDHAGQGVCKDS